MHNNAPVLDEARIARGVVFVGDQHVPVCAQTGGRRLAVRPRLRRLVLRALALLVRRRVIAMLLVEGAAAPKEYTILFCY